ncbi:hypothetical protein V8C86DRAFT_3032443 [Haematococcus lacustris]
MSSRKALASHIAMLSLAALLAALLVCSPVRAQAADSGSECACFEVYQPVCGSNNATYSNACKAGCAGIKNYTNGPCEGSFVASRLPALELPVNASSSVACNCSTNGTNAVCGSDGITFASTCFAGCSNVTVVSQGPCPKGDSGKRLCACPRIYQPVCGAGLVTYANKCLAECADVELLGQGPCPIILLPGEPGALASVCGCNNDVVPVCDTSGRTWMSACYAICLNASVAYAGLC